MFLLFWIMILCLLFDSPLSLCPIPSTFTLNGSRYLVAMLLVWIGMVRLPHGLICPVCCGHVGQNQTGLVIVTLREQKSDATLRAVVRWPSMGKGRVLHLASLVLTFGLRSPDQTKAWVRQRETRAGFCFLWCPYCRFTLTCQHWRNQSSLISYALLLLWHAWL